MPWLMASIATCRRCRSSAQDPTYFFCPIRLPVGGPRRPAGQPPSRLPALFAAAGRIRGRADVRSHRPEPFAPPPGRSSCYPVLAGLLGRRALATAVCAGTRTGGVSAPAPETRWQLSPRHPRTAPIVRA
jgi:hypothetical protein